MATNEQIVLKETLEKALKEKNYVIDTTAFVDFWRKDIILTGIKPYEKISLRRLRDVYKTEIAIKGRIYDENNKIKYIQFFYEFPSGKSLSESPNDYDLDEKFVKKIERFFKKLEFRDKLKMKFRKK